MLLYSFTSEWLDKNFYVVVETPQLAFDMFKAHLLRNYADNQDAIDELRPDLVHSHDTYTVMEDRDL